MSLLPHLPVRLRRIPVLLASSLGLALRELPGSGALSWAAGISYYAILAIFPFLLLVVVVSTSVLADPALSVQAIRWMGSYLPTGRHILVDALPTLQRISGQIGLVSAASLAWTSMGLFSAVRTALDQMSGLPRRPSALLQHWASLVAVVVASLGLLVLIALSTFLGVIGHLSLERLSAGFTALGPGFSLAADWLRRPVSFALQTTSLLLGRLVTWIAAVAVLNYLPAHRPGLRHCLVPALGVTIAVEALKSGLLWSVQSRGNFTMIHGPLSAAIAFMLWAYLTALALLLGGLWTFQLRRQSGMEARRRLLPPPEPTRD